MLGKGKKLQKSAQQDNQLIPPDFLRSVDVWIVIISFLEEFKDRKSLSVVNKFFNKLFKVNNLLKQEEFEKYFLAEIKAKFENTLRAEYGEIYIQEMKKIKKITEEIVLSDQTKESLGNIVNAARKKIVEKEPSDKDCVRLDIEILRYSTVCCLMCGGLALIITGIIYWIAQTLLFTGSLQDNCQKQTSSALAICQSNVDESFKWAIAFSALVGIVVAGALLFIERCCDVFFLKSKELNATLPEFNSGNGALVNHHRFGNLITKLLHSRYFIALGLGIFLGVLIKKQGLEGFDVSKCINEAMDTLDTNCVVSNVTNDTRNLGLLTSGSSLLLGYASPKVVSTLIGGAYTGAKKVYETANKCTYFQLPKNDQINAQPNEKSNLLRPVGP